MTIYILICVQDLSCNNTCYVLFAYPTLNHPLSLVTVRERNIFYSFEMQYKACSQLKKEMRTKMFHFGWVAFYVLGSSTLNDTN